MLPQLLLLYLNSLPQLPTVMPRVMDKKHDPPYPKAGTGLMSKLGPDEDDIEWLVDNGDYEAFSHVVYDEQGNRVEDNGGL
ncbi:PHD domain containing protein [Rutstroemia sp. NJR-2017a BBW]|nr:PHD domain containing protein [Rutstroemia sp. NJR-2017a BBW]